MIAIFVGLLKFLGACFAAFIVFAIWAICHVGKRGDRQKKWWEDDERC